MPYVSYKTGVSMWGMDEWSGAYFCDYPGCESEADYGIFCEEHFQMEKEAVVLEDMPETAWPPDDYCETLPWGVWCECGHISGQHGIRFPHPCATGGYDGCVNGCKTFRPKSEKGGHDGSKEEGFQKEASKEKEGSGGGQHGNNAAHRNSRAQSCSDHGRKMKTSVVDRLTTTTKKTRTIKRLLNQCGSRAERRGVQ